MAKPSLLFACLLLGAGCSRTGPALGGKVTLDGKPVAGATVRFHPESALQAPAFFTITAADGSFALPGSDDNHAGLPAGSYRVTVVKFEARPLAEAKKMSDYAPEKSLLPVAYADPTKTPLRIELTRGSNSIDLPLVASP